MSLAEENVAVVRRGYDAFNSADMATLTEIFHQNASWHTPGRAIGGDYVGREAAFGQFGRYAGETGGTFKAALQDVFASADGRVIGMHHKSAEARR
jgi:ketosteroid isomerase-like protein